MRRHLNRTVSALSLLLAVGAAVPWVRSYSGSDYVSRARLVRGDPEAVVTRGHAITWTRGTVRLTASEHTVYPRGHDVAPAPADPPASWSRGRLGRGHLGWEDLPVRSVWNRFGFHAYEDGSGASFYDEQSRGIAFPAWVPVAAFAMPSLIAATRGVKAERRRRRGLCARCGYDLRASSERCPECGDPVRASATL